MSVCEREKERARERDVKGERESGTEEVRGRKGLFHTLQMGYARPSLLYLHAERTHVSVNLSFRLLTFEKKNCREKRRNRLSLSGYLEFHR